MKVEVCSARMPVESLAGVAWRRDVSALFAVIGTCLASSSRRSRRSWANAKSSKSSKTDDAAVPPADPPPADRRYRPHVTHALERDGFVIVAPFETRPTPHDHLKLPQDPEASPIERPGLKEADERQLLRILGFKRRRRTRRRRWLILTGLIGAMLALLTLSPVGKTLVNRTRPAEPLLTDEKTPRAAETRGPRPGLAVMETPMPNPEVRALQSTGRGESPETGRPRAADTMRRRVPGPSVDAPATPVLASSTSESPRTGVALKAPSLQDSLPHVDVTRKSSEGGGEAYAVRLAYSGGRPLTGAEVVLRIRMAAGTLLDVSLGAGPDLGTYSVTMPPLHSAPVDLRLRVVTNNTRVEIPLTP